MSTSSILSQQTQNAYHWVNKIIKDVPENKWDEYPPVIESTITWQVGHLMMSFYYHTVMCTIGHQPDIFEQIPLKAYADYFSPGTPKDSIGKCDPKALKDELNIMMNKSIKVIGSLSETDLNATLAPTKFKHPIAQTKFEAIDWNIKHTMWHCGQIATLKRLIGQPLSFLG